MSEPIEAAELLETLERVQERIAGFRPLTNEEIIAIRKASSLDRDWVVQAVGALGASEKLQAVVGATPEDLFVEIADERQWDRAERQMRALLNGLAATNLARRHRIGVKALQIYGIARHLVRQPEHSHLIPFVERLQQMNKLGKRKKKTPPAEE
ncbi:MAG TPA: hypothetical protein VF432_02250 [Thermoanaerobaculia bacterium]